MCGQSGSLLIQPSVMASHASGSFLPLLDLHLGSGRVSEESTPSPPLPWPVLLQSRGLNNNLPDWIEFELSMLPSPPGLPNGLVLLIPTGSQPSRTGGAVPRAFPHPTQEGYGISVALPYSGPPFPVFLPTKGTCLESEFSSGLGFHSLLKI